MSITISKTGETFKLGALRSQIDERDYVAASIYPKNVAYPKKLDYRDQMTPVRNQGSDGTCSAQVIAAMKEWQEQKQKKLTGDSLLMSPQYIFNLRENKAVDGMEPRETFKILQKDGICREILYPYGSEENPSQRALTDAQNFKIEGYASVDSIETLKKSLYKNGPCYISVPVYNDTEEMWNARQNDKLIGGHAMTIVGYDDEGFIIRNSWGWLWGDKGHTKMKYKDFGKQWEIWTCIDTKSATPDNVSDVIWQRTKDIALYALSIVVILFITKEIIMFVRKSKLK